MNSTFSRFSNGGLPVRNLIEKFQKRIRGRLKDWKEEEHRADAELARITKHERARINPQDPFLGREPGRPSGLKNVSENHDEYLYGKKRKRGLLQRS